MAGIDIADWTKLGAVIRSERKRAGLTQEQLAERSGTSRSWIARVEAGHRKVELEQLLRLLSALELSMNLRRVDSSEGQGVPGGARNRDAQRRSWAVSVGAAQRIRDLNTTDPPRPN